MYVKMDNFTADLVKNVLEDHIQVLGSHYDEMAKRVDEQDRPANGYQSLVLFKTEMKMERLSDVVTQIGILLSVL